MPSIAKSEAMLLLINNEPRITAYLEWVHNVGALFDRLGTKKLYLECLGCRGNVQKDSLENAICFLGRAAFPTLVAAHQIKSISSNESRLKLKNNLKNVLSHQKVSVDNIVLSGNVTLSPLDLITEMHMEELLNKDGVFRVTVDNPRLGVGAASRGIGIEAAVAETVPALLCWALRGFGTDTPAGLFTSRLINTQIQLWESEGFPQLYHDTGLSIPYLVETLKPFA